MNDLKQITLKRLKALFIRCFPGLAGYHVIRYARVENVYQSAAIDVDVQPAMAVDLRFLKHDFTADERYKVKKRIRLAGGSEFVQAPPSRKTVVLVAFPYWFPSTATVLASIYLNKPVSPEEKKYQIKDCEKLNLSAKSEFSLGEANDQAVLGNEMVTVMENLIDSVVGIKNQIIALGSQDSTGAPCLSLPGVQTQLTAIENDLNIIKTMLPDDILSDIKLGKGTDAPLS